MGNIAGRIRSWPDMLEVPTIWCCAKEVKLRRPNIVPWGARSNLPGKTTFANKMPPAAQLVKHAAMARPAMLLCNVIAERAAAAHPIAPTNAVALPTGAADSAMALAPMARHVAPC